MNSEPASDEFSNAALFPELTEAQRLGFQTTSRLGPDGAALRQEAATTEVACRLTPADIQAVHEALYRPAWGARHWGRHERWRRVLAAMALTTFVVLLIKLFARNKLGADLVGWDGVAGAMLGGAVIGLWWARQNTTVPVADSPVYRPYTLSLDTSGFRVRGEGFDNHIDWNQVTSLREAGGCLLIDTRFDGSRIVPRSAFASAEAAGSFIARATALREAVVNPPSSMPLTRLRYRPTRDDVRAFFALKRAPGGWRGALFYLLLFPAMLILGLLMDGLGDTAWLLGFALGLGAVWLLTRAILLIDQRLAMARHPLSEGEIELQCWGDHLRVIADGNETRTTYAQLGNVVATSDHVFLMTAPDRSIIVPRRAFVSDAEMAAFAAEVDRCSQESTP